MRSLIAIITFIGVSSVWADQPIKPTEPKVKTDDAKAPVADGDKDAVSDKNTADKEEKKQDEFEKLIKDLKPNEGKPQEKVGQKIQRIAERMQAVHRRLAAAKTDLETQAVEHQVVKDIDDLLDFVRKQQQNQNNSSSSSSQQQQQQQQQQRQRTQVKSQNQRPQQQKGQQQQQQNAKQQQQQQESKQSGNDPKGNGKKTEAEKLREALRFQDWGHLPPAVREELLQSFKEEFLPQYRKMLEVYYRSLADKKAREAE